MKEKRVATLLSVDQARAIVRAWHRDEATQRELADRYQVTRTYVCRLCHGNSRKRDVYDVIAAELAAGMAAGAVGE